MNEDFEGILHVTIRYGMSEEMDSEDDRKTLFRIIKYYLDPRNFLNEVNNLLSRPIVNIFPSIFKGIIYFLLYPPSPSF